MAKDIPGNLIFFIGAMVAIGALSLDAYLPAMPAIAVSITTGTSGPISSITVRQLPTLISSIRMVMC